MILAPQDECQAAPAKRNKLAILVAEYQQTHAAFAAEMTALAEQCESNGFATEAEEIRQWAVPAAEQSLDMDALPERRQPELPLSLPPLERQWRIRLAKLRGDYAQSLYLLSQRAIREGSPSLAFHWLREVAFHDPDHRMARKALGYVPCEDGWATPFAAERQKRGFVWHDQFGWLQRTHVARYEKGERYYNGKWITAQKEASIRSDFNHGWQVLTEHFEIRTNHSLERGVELGVAMEQFHRFFVREFAECFNTPQQMQALFDAGSQDLRGSGRRHLVHYYRTRQEYVAALKRKQANIEMTNGIYLPDDRTAYFFEDPQANAHLETLFHEITHQLLSESARSIENVGADANFWIIEGLACYMESFRPGQRGPVVGDPLHSRIHWARTRVIDENFLIPFDQFTAMGMREFQFGGDTPTLQRYYSQASGMAHFFLHYEGGVYRDALIKHLSQVYSPDSRVRARAARLDELTGVSFEELGRQYVEYARGLPSLLADVGASAE